MFSTWDLVRPRFWHPMASFEQSLMDLESLGDHMRYAYFPLHSSMRMLSAPRRFDDDDFFSDLPVHVHYEVLQPQTQTQSEGQPAQVDKPDEPMEEQRETELQTPSIEVGPRAFSSYSFSSSSVINDKGQQVTSTRRRYEDSTGQLKAVHERQIHDRKLRDEWHRKDKQDEGTHRVTCTNGTAEEFEKLWQQTAFGAQEEKQKQQAIEDKKDEKEKGSKAKAKEKKEEKAKKGQKDEVTAQ